MIILEQMRDIAIIMKHVEAMSRELDKARESDSFSWGEGAWAEPKIIIVTDADEPLGTVVVDDTLVKFSAGADSE